MNEEIEAKLKDIQEHPEKHRHDYAGLHRCCMVGGAIVLTLIDAHSKSVDMGMNGGRRCDVTSGPCACGAWH